MYNNLYRLSFIAPLRTDLLIQAYTNNAVIKLITTSACHLFQVTLLRPDFKIQINSKSNIAKPIADLILQPFPSFLQFAVIGA